MKIKKMPAELFVVIKRIEDFEYIQDSNGNWVKGPSTFSKFGFLHANDGNASKQRTQLGWAYESDAHQESDGTWWHNRFKIENGHYVVDEKGYGRATERVQIDPEYAPRVWQNVPLTGFKIIDTVNRYRGNKLMKVLDPRGVEFEITIKSLFQIITMSTIKNGEIMDACIWKTNKDLVIVPKFGVNNG